MKAIISSSKIGGSIEAPSSKSYSHRAVILATLANGQSTINNYLNCQDTDRTLNACRKLGSIIERRDGILKIKGVNGFRDKTPNDHFSEIYAGNSGTTVRLITAVAALCPGEVEINGDERMQKRPMSELFRVLRDQGVDLKDSNGFVPVIVKGGKLKGGRIRVSANLSSQFISSLLIVLPYAQNASEVIIKDFSSKPYIDMTIQLMKIFGFSVQQNNNIYYVPMGGYENSTYKVEGDVTSSSYLFAAAAVTNSEIDVYGIDPHTKQGDIYFLKILKDLGCRMKNISDGISLSAKITRGINIDMGNYPDIVPSLAIVAATVRDETNIRNIGSLRYKESDRIESIKLELTKMGVKVESTNDSLSIYGGPLHGSEIDTHNDHRIAMSMAVAALVAEGKTIINNAEVVSKSYPNFWKDFKKIGAKVELV